MDNKQEIINQIAEKITSLLKSNFLSIEQKDKLFVILENLKR